MNRSMGVAVLVATAVSVSACISTRTATRTVTTTVTENVPGPTVTVTVPGPTVTATAPQPKQSTGSTSSTILTYSGNGIWTSQPFNAPSEITASYSFSDCAGGSGNFIADVITTAGPTSGNYDDQSVANQLSAGGSATTAVYPQYPGSQYDLQVNSECSFTIKLTSG